MPPAWADNPNQAVGTAGRGARLAALGDTCDVVITVISALPAPLELSFAALALAQLARVPGRGGGGPGGYPASASAALALAGSQQQPERVFSCWEERDEIVVSTIVDCRPCGPCGNDRAASGNCENGAGGDGSGGASVSGRPPAGGLALQPGANRLVFRVSAVCEGLFALRSLRLGVGSAFELCVQPAAGGNAGLGGSAGAGFGRGNGGGSSDGSGGGYGARGGAPAAPRRKLGELLPGAAWIACNTHQH